jgi:hypothetical protein
MDYAERFGACMELTEGVGLRGVMFCLWLVFCTD